jgi:hypothetical protein
MKRAIAILAATATAAAASPRVERKARELRAALVDARRECKQPGAKLDAMVERVFSVEGFGRRVIDHWVDLTDEQRAEFDVHAQTFVGRAEQARAIMLLCLPGRVSTAFETDTNLFFIDVQPPDPEGYCTQLIFHAEGKRWLFDGEWFCGVSVFWSNWRRRLGNGDYAKAMVILRDTTPPGRAAAD